MEELTFFYKLAEINQAATQLIYQAAMAKIWLFVGDMGAGKTTLIKSISETLGASGEFSSPTYSLANEYRLSANKKIFHLDLYRLRSFDEAMDIGIEDYLFGGDYCFVEWPQLIMPLLKKGEFITIQIESISAIERKITIFM